MEKKKPRQKDPRSKGRPPVLPGEVLDERPVGSRQRKFGKGRYGTQKTVPHTSGDEPD